ncbi:MAG: hypothetical protein AB1486_29630 [Planctomycetota bacterium]
MKALPFSWLLLAEPRLHENADAPEILRRAEQASGITSLSPDTILFEEWRFATTALTGAERQWAGQTSGFRLEQVGGDRLIAEMVDLAIDPPLRAGFFRLPSTIPNGFVRALGARVVLTLLTPSQPERARQWHARPAKLRLHQ